MAVVLKLWFFLLAVTPMTCVVGLLLHAFSYRRARHVDKAALVMAAVAIVLPFLLLLVRPSSFFGVIGPPESHPDEAFHAGPFIVALLVGVPSLLVSSVALLNSTRHPFD